LYLFAELASSGFQALPAVQPETAFGLFIDQGEGCDAMGWFDARPIDTKYVVSLEAESLKGETDPLAVTWRTPNALRTRH
jgi:hypothetical protein